MHSESLQKLFSWVLQVCNLETDTQRIIHAKEQKITLITLLSLAFVIPAHIRAAVAHRVLNQHSP